MTVTLRSLPLRVLLPVLVLTVSTLLLGAMGIYEQRQITALMERQALEDAGNELARLQRAIAIALSRGDPASAEREITSQGTRRDLVALVAIDDAGNVLFANRFAWKGRPAVEVLPGFSPAAAETARAGTAPLLAGSPAAQNVTGYATLRLPSELGELRSQRQGLLFLHRSLEPQYASASRLVWTEAAFMWLAAIAAIALLLWLLHHFVAVPVRRLAVAAPKLAAGDSEALAISGRGELADLGRALRNAGAALRRSLEDLSEREASYRGIVDNAGIGIMLVDHDMKLREANQALRTWFPDLALGDPCYRLLSGVDADGVCPFCRARESMADGNVREVVATVQRGDESRQFRIISSPVKSPDGDTIGCVEMLEDITDSVRREQELARVQRALTAVSACNAAAVRATDEQRLLDEICRITVEGAGYRMAWIGRPRQDAARSVIPVASAGVEQSYLREVGFSWGDNPHGRGPVGTAIRTRQVSTVSDVMTDPRFEPWRDAALAHGFRGVLGAPLLIDGEVEGVLAVYAAETGAFGADEEYLLEEMADTLAYGIRTLRYQEALEDREERLRRLNSELEARVDDRTAALQRSNAELEAFSYSVSHDLRAPLRGIDGFSNLLLRRYGDRLDDTGRDYLERIRRGTQRMGQLIDDLLGLSRITRCELRPQPVDLSHLVAQVANALREAEPERHVTVHVAQGLRTHADPRLVGALLENLLGNAWKYTGRRTDATIEFGQTSVEGQNVFFVRDNGAGFDMAYADKLFQPFSRLHRVDEFDGTGIGLATVRRIVERHRGRIWAEAEPDVGATFFFCLGCDSGKGALTAPARATETSI